MTDQTPNVRYFFAISVEFTKTLDEPKKTYFDGGYRIQDTETGQGFLAETVELPADDKSATRIGFLNYAIERALNAQNKMRTQQGCTVMFDHSNVIVKWFDCGRNEI